MSHGIWKSRLVDDCWTIMNEERLGDMWRIQLRKNLDFLLDILYLILGTLKVNDLNGHSFLRALIEAI
jgi:hypothetical protein